MKLLLIILSIYTSVYGNNSITYSNSHNIYSSIPVEQTYRGIGYSTNYSNGQFNSTHYYQGYYTPEESSSGRRTVKPRRVVIKHGNDSIDTGRQDDYDPDWKYYHGVLRGWYYDDGNNHWWWNGSDWVEIQQDKSWDIIKWVSKKADASPSTPVGDAIVPLLILLLLYMFYDLFIRHTLKK